MVGEAEGDGLEVGWKIRLDHQEAEFHFCRQRPSNAS